MKIRFAGVSCLLLSLGTASADSRANATRPELTVYVYDSWAAPGGLGEAVFPLFEKQCGCVLLALPSGDGSAALSRLALDQERGHAGAELVVGLDGPTSQRAASYVEPLSPALIQLSRKKLVDQAQSALGAGFIAYDYGYFAFIADQDQLKKQKLVAPTRFADLLRPEWRRNLILEDPRTSTPGLSFVLYGEALSADWSKLKSQWLTLAPGWDGAYGLFLKGEAPLVWSYTTSQAYHEEHGDRAHRYTALIFNEGQPVQVEGAALVKGAFEGEGGKAKRKLAESFLSFLVSPQAQALIPTRNWMYPARKGIELPASFAHLPKPGKAVNLPNDPALVKRALDHWAESIQ
jgi:thiamine transport system substrate-binding protein